MSVVRLKYREFDLELPHFFDKDEERVRLMYPIIKIYLGMAAAFSNVTSTFIKVLPLLEVESIQVLIYGPHSTQNTFRHCVPFATLWKCQDFYVIQILREINFRESRSSKNTVFAILQNRILNFMGFF